MKLIDNIENKLIYILCGKFKYVNFRNQPLSFKILHIFWYLSFSIPRYIIWLFTQRFICMIKGCNIIESQGGYVEDCLRCEAWEEFGETSKYKLIKKE